MQPKPMKSHFCDKSLVDICDAVGGLEVFRRVSKRFHHKIEQDAVLNGLFPKNMAALEERLALYLTERTGGPSGYTTARGKNSLLCRHAHLAIGTAEAGLWLTTMAASLLEEGVGEETTARLLANLTEIAATIADPFVYLYQLPLADLREKLRQDPLLAVTNNHGRNLICAAATAWDVPRVRLLLEFGAQVEEKDTGGHTPLYRAANGTGCEMQGKATVELLIGYGSNVNQATGICKTTPLHMAARRGTVAIARALLTAGAQVEARDAKGATPLQRAVNCGQENMVRLLLTHGANPQSQDRAGRTVLDAARHEPIRTALQEV